MPVSVLERSRDLANFDPFGLEFREDPLGWYPSLLEASPLAVELDDIPSIVIGKAAHVSAVMRDYKRFSSIRPKHVQRMERIDFFNSSPVMNYSDPPLHNRLRRVVQPIFNPMRVVEMRVFAERICNNLLSNIKPGDVVEVQEGINRPFSTELFLTDFLGIPPEDQKTMTGFMNAVKLLDDLPLGAPKPQVYLDAWDAGVAYCKHQVDLAHQGKCTSIISMIVDAYDAGTISDDELMAMVVSLYVGGVSNVATMASLSLYYMVTVPELLERVRQDPEVAGRILEEALRLNSPVLSVLRFATEDTEIAGTPFKAGTPVYCMIGAACFDPEAWPEPATFNIDRPKPNEHLALGYGVHTCMGAAVTRATVPLLVSMIANRFPGLSFAKDNRLEFEMRPRARNVSRLELTF